jgi:hypothetical protein
LLLTLLRCRLQVGIGTTMAKAMVGRPAFGDVPRNITK